MRMRCGTVKLMGLAWMLGCGSPENEPRLATAKVLTRAADSVLPLQPPKLPPRSAVATVRPPHDSAIQLAVTTRIAGRGQNDSISLVAAIRQGLRHPGWQASADASPPLAG